MSIMHEKIAVLYGGNSAERDISLMSGQAVAKGLCAAGFDAHLIDTKVIPLNHLVEQNFERAFIALHGRGGEDGCIQGALEYLGIPYTGSGVLGSALSMDKVRCKQIWQCIGLPTAPFIVVEQESFQANDCNKIIEQLGGKVMVKPSHEGSSIGMAMADSASTLSEALTKAFAYDSQVLIEAWINGPEYTVAILGKKALPVIHMETPRSFYDYEAKYQSTTTQYHCPSNLSDSEESTVQALALKAFHSTNASGWGRVDIMRNEQGEWQLLEVNTVPGMTETSLVPKAAKVAGYSFDALVSEILTLSGKE